MTAPISGSEEWQPSDLERNRRIERRRKTRKNGFIAAISSVLVLGTFAIVLVNSPGWLSLRDTFFKWAFGVEVLPKIILGFTTNLTLTLVAGSSVALLGLLLALVRTSRSPALTPFRFLATIYVDVFRGIPMILVILLIGFGIQRCKYLASPMKFSSSEPSRSSSPIPPTSPKSCEAAS